MALTIKGKKIFVVYNDNQSAVRLYSTLKTLCEDYENLSVHTLYKFDWMQKVYFKDNLKISQQRIN